MKFLEDFDNDVFGKPDNSTPKPMWLELFETILYIIFIFGAIFEIVKILM